MKSVAIACIVVLFCLVLVLLVLLAHAEWEIYKRENNEK